MEVLSRGCRWRFCQGGVVGGFVKGCRWRFCQGGVVRGFVKGV